MKTPGSGRKPGSVNKKTQDLMETAERLSCDPFEILLMFANGDHEGLKLIEPGVTADQRLHAAKEAAKYLYPQRKAVEVSTGDEGFKVIVEDYTSKVK